MCHPGGSRDDPGGSGQSTPRPAVGGSGSDTAYPFGARGDHLLHAAGPEQDGTSEGGTPTSVSARGAGGHSTTGCAASGRSLPLGLPCPPQTHRYQGSMILYEFVKR